MPSVETVGGLRVRLFVDSKEFDQGLQKAEKRAGLFQSAIEGITSAFASLTMVFTKMKSLLIGGLALFGAFKAIQATLKLNKSQMQQISPTIRALGIGGASDMSVMDKIRQTLVDLYVEIQPGIVAIITVLKVGFLKGAEFLASLWTTSKSILVNLGLIRGLNGSMLSNFSNILVGIALDLALVPAAIAQMTADIIRTLAGWVIDFKNIMSKLFSLFGVFLNTLPMVLGHVLRHFLPEGWHDWVNNLVEKMAELIDAVKPSLNDMDLVTGATLKSWAENMKAFAAVIDIVAKRLRIFGFDLRDLVKKIIGGISDGAESISPLKFGSSLIQSIDTAIGQAKVGLTPYHAKMQTAAQQQVVQLKQINKAVRQLGPS